MMTATRILLTLGLLFRTKLAQGTYSCPSDFCPDAPFKTNFCICECECVVSDKDSDCDGVVDGDDECPEHPYKIWRGVCGCGESEDDTDGDGVKDCHDECPEDPYKTWPGVCGCGESEDDTDGDGVKDCHDECPEDPYKTWRGIFGCGEPDADTDGDGVIDCHDECPEDPHKTQPAVCGCGRPDRDQNNNGVIDCLELHVACLTGKYEPAAVVTVSSGKRKALFEITPFPSWMIFQVGIALALTYEDLPQTHDGNAKPSHFECRGADNQLSFECHYPLGYQCGDQLFFAVHAYGLSAEFEGGTVWCGTSDKWFEGNERALYFSAADSHCNH